MSVSSCVSMSLRRYSRRVLSSQQRVAFFSSSTAKDSFEERPLDTPLQSTTTTTTTPPLMERSDKNIFSQFFDKYSIKQQTDRILVAESFLEAATRQASDP
jgi:uncharacterized protein YaiI (UPF0178 family)